MFIKEYIYIYFKEVMKTMEQTNFPKMRRSFGQVQTSVLVSQEFYKLCKDHHIKFSEAIRVGIGVILAERGVREYDGQLNFFRKLQVVGNRLNETSQKYWKLIEEAKAKGMDVSAFEKDGD